MFKISIAITHVFWNSIDRLNEAQVFHNPNKKRTIFEFVYLCMKNNEISEKMEREAKLINRAIAKEKLKNASVRKLPEVSKKHFKIEL